MTLLLALSPLSAQCLGAEWVSGPKSQARLIDGGVLDGVRTAGVEIRMAGGAITYWRDPGEAGAPPVFDFSGSDNVADATPLYPQPRRIDEAGLQASGYRGEVVFPVRVTPRDPEKPMTLALSLEYAVCDTLCLPGHARLKLDLPAKIDGADGAARVAEALRQTPKRIEAGKIATLAPAPADGGHPQWRMSLSSADSGPVFVEAPAGFYFETRAAAGAWLLSLVEHPPEKPLPDAPVRVTVSGREPVEFDLRLPSP